jgi:hypothetical protein
MDGTFVQFQDVEFDSAESRPVGRLDGGLRVQVKTQETVDDAVSETGKNISLR